MGDLSAVPQEKSMRIFYKYIYLTQNVPQAHPPSTGNDPSRRLSPGAFGTRSDLHVGWHSPPGNQSQRRDRH